MQGVSNPEASSSPIIGNGTSTEKECHIDRLPNTLLREIFGLFTHEFRNTLCLVSKKWNVQASHNTIWECLFQKEFPESYKAHFEEREWKKNDIFWKSLFVKCQIIKRNISTHNSSDEACFFDKVQIFAVQIDTHRFFKANYKEGATWLTIENTKTSALRNIILSKFYEAVHQIKTDKEIVYALADYTIWIIHPDDTVQTFELEKILDWQLYQFKSFASDENFLYARVDYYPKKNVIYRYDLSSKKRDVLFEPQIESSGQKNLELHQDQLFMTTGPNKISSFHKITGKETGQYECSSDYHIQNFKIYQDKLFVITQYIYQPSNMEHHTIYMCDLNCNTPTEVKTFSCIGEFSCKGDMVDMQFFDRYLFCGVANIKNSQIFGIPFDKIGEVFYFEEQGRLISFSFANGILAISLRRPLTNDDKYWIVTKNFNPKNLGRVIN